MHNVMKFSFSCQYGEVNISSSLQASFTALRMAKSRKTLHFALKNSCLAEVKAVLSLLVISFLIPLLI